MSIALSKRFVPDFILTQKVPPENSAGYLCILVEVNLSPERIFQPSSSGVLLLKGGLLFLLLKLCLR